MSRRNTRPSFCPDPVSRVRPKIPADSANGPLSARTAQVAHPSGGHRGLLWRFRREHLPKEYAYFFFYSLVRTSYVKRLAVRRPAGSPAAPLSTVAELALSAVAGALMQTLTISVSAITTWQQLGTSKVEGKAGEQAHGGSFFDVARDRVRGGRRGALARPQAQPRAHLQPRGHARRVRARKGLRACRTGAHRRPEHEP